MRNMSNLGFAVLGQLQAASTGSAMAADTASLYWFDPDNGVTESAGDLTTWTDNTGNGVNLSQVASLTLPGWDAGGFATYAGSTGVIASAGTAGSAMAELDGGGEIAIFAVVQVDSGVSGTLARLPIVCEGNSAEVFQNSTMQLVLEHNDADATNTDVCWWNKRFSLAYNMSPNSGRDLRGTKVIIEAIATQTNAEIFVDGVSIASTTPTVSDFASNGSPIVSIGCVSDGTTASASTFNGNIYEVFVTGNAGASHRSAIRSELASIHGITL